MLSAVLFSGLDSVCCKDVEDLKPGEDDPLLLAKSRPFLDFYLGVFC